MPKYENIQISKLKPYERNARTHSDEQIAVIINSIREFGFRNPVIIDENNMILAGHGRVMAAQRMGIESVPFVRWEDMTEEQKRGFILADNKTADLAGWDLNILNEELQNLDLDMSDFGFDDIPEPDIEIAEDEYDDDPTEEPKTKSGEIYQLGDHRLMCGDSTQPENVMRLAGGGSVDLLLTDPPYNVALGQHMRPSEAKQLHRRTDGLVIDNDKFDDDDDFVAFLTAAFRAADAVLKPGGVYYIWHASNTAKSFLEACANVQWSIRQTLMWNKNTFCMGRQDYQWKHEPCLYGWKDGAAHYFVDDRRQSTVFEDKQQIDPKKLKKDELLELVEMFLSDKISTTVINEDKSQTSEEHPTMKPIKLLARQIRNSTKQGETVLDIFGGSGSTLIACEQLNRKCLMMELDPHYCDVIIQRWENLTGKKAKLISE